MAPPGASDQPATSRHLPLFTDTNCRAEPTLREIQRPGCFERLSAKTSMLVNGLTSAATAAGVPFSADNEGGMFGFFLLPQLPANYGQVMKTEGARFNQLFHGLLDRGVYIAPALYEAGFVSAEHSDSDIAATVQAAREVFAQF